MATTIDDIIRYLKSYYLLTKVTVINKRTALLVNDWADAQELCAKYPELAVESLRTLDGRVYESLGAVSEPYDIASIYAHTITDKADIIAKFNLCDCDYISSLPTHQLAEHLWAAHQLLRDLDEYGPDYILACESGDIYNYYNWHKHRKHGVAYTADGHNYRIAIILDNLNLTQWGN